MPVRVNVPLPCWIKAPPPTSPPLRLWFNPLLNASEPELIVVAPVYEWLPVKVRMLLPAMERCRPRRSAG